MWTLSQYAPPPLPFITPGLIFSCHLIHRTQRQKPLMCVSTDKFDYKDKKKALLCYFSLLKLDSSFPSTVSFQFPTLYRSVPPMSGVRWRANRGLVQADGGWAGAWKPSSQACVGTGSPGMSKHTLALEPNTTAQR